jgi:hypothetical protein
VSPVSSEPRAHALTTLDWIGAIVAGAMTVALLCFPLVGRTFARMYADLSTTPQPMLTRWCTSVWFPLLLGALALGALLAGLRPGAPLSRRRSGVVAAFVLAGLGIALCLAGAYLPIFRMAGAIKAD